MKINRKIWVLIGLVLILSASVILVEFYLAPRYLNSPPVKKKIRRIVEKAVKGKFDYGGVHFSLIPRPGIEMSNVKVSVSSGPRGTLKNLRINLQLLPLLTGKIALSKVELQSPRLKVFLTGNRMEGAKGRRGGGRSGKKKIGEKKEKSKPGRLREQLVILLGEITARAGGLKLHVGDGKIELWQDGEVALTASYLNGKVRVGGESGSLDLSAVLHIPGKLDTSGTIALEFEHSKENTRVILSRLSLSGPHLELRGQLTVPPGEERTRIEIGGKNVDATSLRKIALIFAGKDRTVQDIFGIIREGFVTEIILVSEGPSIENLFQPGNLKITGHLEKGKLFISGIDMNLIGVSGDVDISGGILKGEMLRGDYGNVKVTGGSLMIGISGGKVPFHLEIEVDTPASEVKPIFTKFVAAKSFLREVRILKNLKGRIKGRVVIGETLSNPSVRVDAKDFNISGSYGRIPYRVTLKGGTLHYEPGKVMVKNITVKAGRSVINGVTWKASLGKKAKFSASVGPSTLVLDQLVKWISNMKGGDELFNAYGEIKGTLLLDSLSLKGPLMVPSSWNYKVKGKVRNIYARPDFLPGEITLSQGSFSAIPGKVNVRRLGAKIVDSAVDLSGSLREVGRGKVSADLKISGRIGEKGAAWIGGKTGIPEALLLRAPLEVRYGHLRLGGKEGIFFSGYFLLTSGPEVKVEFRGNEEGFSLNNLEIKDGKDSARGKFVWGRGKAAFAFKGKLTGRSLKRLFLRREESGGRIEGDLTFSYAKKGSPPPRIQGSFKGEELQIFLKGPGRVELDSLALSGNKERLQMDLGTILIGGKIVKFKGVGELSRKGLNVDISASSKGFDWASIGEGEAGEGKKKKKEGKKSDFGIPVEGIVRLDVELLSFDRFSFSPFRADVTFRPHHIGVTVEDASLCGVSSKGEYLDEPPARSFNFNLSGNEGNLENSWNCFLGGKEVITGIFDLRGDLAGAGTDKDIFKLMKGKIDFTAHDGRIYEGGTIARIISLINVTEVFRGKLPDLMKEGFAYNTLSIKGNINKGRFDLKEAHMDGKSLEMVGEGQVNLVEKSIKMNILVSPLKTMDAIVKNIPLVNYILGGNLISLPVKVEGELGNPDVTFLSPGSVGSGLLRTMGRILKAPVKVIEPIIPSKEEKSK